MKFSIGERYERALTQAKGVVESGRTLEATDSIRTWVFRNVPRASSDPDTLCTIEPYPYVTTDVLGELRCRQQGYWCAGYAALLVCVYRDMGLQAATIAFGIEGGYTHALAAVRIVDEWYLQDPYLNVRMTTREENTASINTIYRSGLRKGSIRAISSKGRLQPFIFTCKNRLDNNVVFPHGYHSVGPDKFIGLLHISAEQYFQHPLWPKTEPAILQYTDQDPLTALFLTPLWLSDPKYGYVERVEEHPFWSDMTGCG